MKVRFSGILFVILVLQACALINGSDNILAQESFQIKTEEKKEIINTISKLLEENYVFPNMAEQMGVSIKRKLEKNEYGGFSDAREFAKQLTEDLRNISKDLHIRVIYNPQAAAEALKADEITDEELKLIKDRNLERTRFRNFGFEKVEILDGNIGYLNLRAFYPPENAGETAVAAMNFLANSYAVIIDLRYNGGGWPEMIQLITSYFFTPEIVHLNSIYERKPDKTSQYWTLPHVPGKRMPDIDLYILTSNRTFSAAEEFTYNLKNLKRAVIIGEKTRGGAHPGETMVINNRFLIWVPQGRSINPVSQTNWEGTGVEPDIKVPVDQALDAAYLEALKKVVNKVTNEVLKERIRQIIKTKEK